MIDSNKVRQKAKDYFRAKERVSNLKQQLNEARSEHDDAKEALVDTIGRGNKIAVAIPKYGAKYFKTYTSTQSLTVKDIELITCNCNHC